MSWGRYEALRSSNHALDLYRNSIAELSIDSRPSDYLAVSVETTWDEGPGRLWWKTWINPREALDWERTSIDPADGPEYGDGLADPPDELLLELSAGCFVLAGWTYQVRWLTGYELLAAKERCGVGSFWPDKEPSPEVE
ncbi:MAG: hypothetical protein M3Q98_05475 [Actinomycetota bacterium]|nr:hypothetical protein [Actinomycetota bacterium]